MYTHIRLLMYAQVYLCICIYVMFLLRNMHAYLHLASLSLHVSITTNKHICINVCICMYLSYVSVQLLKVHANASNAKDATANPAASVASTEAARRARATATKAGCILPTFGGAFEPIHTQPVPSHAIIECSKITTVGAGPHDDSCASHWLSAASVQG